MLIRCWTIMRHAHRHVTHHVYPHVRRVARHVVAHKVAVAVPIVVCTVVGGSGAWYHPTAPQALPSSTAGFSSGSGSGSFGNGGAGSGFPGSGVGGFIPETFPQDLPQTVFSELLTAPTGGSPSELFNLSPNVPSKLSTLTSDVPISVPVENQPIPESNSLLMLATMLGASLALWSRRKVSL